jgi:ribosomal protein S27AE
MNPGIEAVRTLAKIGFRFQVDGERLRWRYEGPGDPDPDAVAPLFLAVKEHKPEVLYFLKSFCPSCGGVCFIPDYEGRALCMACDWAALVEMYPDLEVKH